MPRSGVTATAVLVGCHRLTPLSLASGPSSDLESVAKTAFLSSPTLSPRTSEPLFQRIDPPTPSVQPELIWTAPAMSIYAFERIEPLIAASVPAELQARTSTDEPKQSAASIQEPVAEEDTGALVESGIASTYGEGDGFQGNRTACGQRFDTHVPQVAHQSLPCGTRVRVEDANSGQSVVVEVTDRGPYVTDRVVDLSWAAFSQLDPEGHDLLSVNVYVMSKQ